MVILAQAPDVCRLTPEVGRLTNGLERADDVHYNIL